MHCQIIEGGPVMQHTQTSDQRIAWPPGHSPATALVFAMNVVEIAASPNMVWSLLIDCVKWPRWYKHCSDVSMLRGGPLLDVQAKFRFKTLGFYFEPEIETFSPDHMLVWSANGPAGTSGSHAWYIEPTPGGGGVTKGLGPAASAVAFAEAASRGARRLATVAQTASGSGIGFFVVSWRNVCASYEYSGGLIQPTRRRRQ